MAKKKYCIEHTYSSGLVQFEVDLEKFTHTHAQETLDFFSWDYDDEGDPIDEVVKKYALEVFRVGGGSSHLGVIHYWSQEGFGPIDGEIGITLTDYTQIEITEDDIEMEVTNG